MYSCKQEDKPFTLFSDSHHWVLRL